MKIVKNSKLKVQNCNSKFKIIFGLFLALTFHFSLLTFNLAPVVRGQSPSLEPSPTEAEELDEKIQDIREAVKEKVQEKLADVKKGQKRAFVGEIDAITNPTLTLTTRHGKKQAKIDEETKIINQERKEIEIKGLEIGDSVIAMGYLEDTDVLTAMRVVVIEKTEPLNREVALGRVTDISEEKVLTAKNERKGITYTIEITGKTTVTKKIEGEIEKLEFSEIELDDFLIIIGTPSENEEKIITAKIIHVVPASSSTDQEATDQESEVESEESEETEESTPSPSPAEETEE